ASTLYWNMPRLIMNCPDDMVIDHINGNRLDNQRSNLRICTQQQNIWNSRKKRGYSNKYKGVTQDKRFPNSFRAIIQGKYLGTFKTSEEAKVIYDLKAKELYGEYNNLN